jgi:endonuclease IV
LAEEFEDTWDIEITADITQAESELDSINSKLEELEDKHIEVAIDWDGIDEIENGMKQTAEFTKLLKNETKKVGNSYQMTAAQAKDWM